MIRRFGRWVLNYEPAKIENSLPKNLERLLSYLASFPILSDGGLSRNYFLSSFLGFGPVFSLFVLSGMFFYFSPYSSAAKFAIISIGGMMLLGGIVGTIFWLPQAYRVAPTAHKEVLAGVMAILSLTSMIGFICLWFVILLSKHI